MGVWDASSPNSNGTPALIYAGFGTGGLVTITKTGGGMFNLDSVDIMIGWYDANMSDVVTVVAGANTYYLTLLQGIQTYKLHILGASSIPFSDGSSGTGYWLVDNVVYNTTPEPGTLALLGSGVLAGVAVLRRKFMV